MKVSVKLITALAVFVLLVVGFIGVTSSVSAASVLLDDSSFGSQAVLAQKMAVIDVDVGVSLNSDVLSADEFDTGGAQVTFLLTPIGSEMDAVPQAPDLVLVPIAGPPISAVSIALIMIVGIVLVLFMRTHLALLRGLDVTTFIDAALGGIRVAVLQRTTQALIGLSLWVSTTVFGKLGRFFHLRISVESRSSSENRNDSVGSHRQAFG